MELSVGVDMEAYDDQATAIFTVNPGTSPLPSLAIVNIEWSNCQRQTGHLQLFFKFQLSIWTE